MASNRLLALTGKTLYSAGLKKDWEMPEKVTTKKTRKSHKDLRDLDMPDDPRELVKALFDAADRKVREKKLRKGRQVA